MIQIILVVFFAMLIFTDFSKIKKKFLNFLKKQKNKRKGI